MRRSLIPLLVMLPAGYAQAQSVSVPLPQKPADPATAPAPGPTSQTTVPLPVPAPPAGTTVAPPPDSAPKPGKYKLPVAPPLNPYGRSIDLTVNVQFFQIGRASCRERV